MLEVLDGGLLTTVQDAGRPGLGDLGVPVGGPADPRSHAIANLLAANEPGAAALEVTVLGPRLRADAAVAIALAGADLGAVIGPSGRRFRPGHVARLRPGDELSFAGRPDGAAGARAYLALPGGLDVPVVLGSRSTCLAGGFGGLHGRRLQAGDRLTAARAGSIPAGRAWPGRAGPAADPREPVIRVLPGPHVERLGRGALDAFLATSWTVAPDTDRMGIRLAGPALRDGGESIVSFGVPWGAVQAPPDGRPIVLLADHQPTGGYPVVAVAIAADRELLGQLAPGDRLRFAATTAADALSALVAATRELAAGREQLDEAARLDDLEGWAGG